MRTLTDDQRKRLEAAVERRWGQSLMIDIIPTAMGNWMVIDKETGARLRCRVRLDQRIKVLNEYPPRQW